MMATNTSEGDPEKTGGARNETTIEAPDLEEPVIEDLSPATIAGVATRLANSTTFTELVSRECELDALWTLCDITLSHMPAGPAATRDSASSEVNERDTLLGLRTLLGEAVSALSGSHHEDATRLVIEASTLASRLQ
jgi:hypothetical protein